MTRSKNNSFDREKATNSEYFSKTLLTSGVAVLAAFSFAGTAWATIDNTVTATGTAPNASTVNDTASENVDVQDAVPAYTIAKSPSVASVSAAGETITYTYTFTNTGNVTITNISLSDLHEGNALTIGSMAGDAGNSSTTTSDAGGDQVWDALGPGDEVTWTSSYTVTQSDIDNNGGGDGTLDNTVTPSSTPVTGTYGATPTATASVSLPAQAASLTVAKLATELNGSPLADPDTANAQVGDIITYSYTITNTGNVTLTNVNLSDVFAGPPGGDGAVTAPVEDPSTLINNSGNSADAVVDGIWDTLGVNDVIVFTSTYTVTQSDVDNP